MVPSQFADSGSDSDIDEQHLPPLPINTLQSYLPTFYNKENPRSSWNSLPFSVNRFFRQHFGLFAASFFFIIVNPLSAVYIKIIW